MTEPLPPTGIPPGTYVAHRWQPQKMVWWYWALMDAMISEPWKTKKQLAEQFNISVITFNLVTTSDIFQAYMAERRKGNSDHLDAVIRQRATRVVDKAFETMEKIIDKKQDTIPLNDLVNLADKTLERLGYGVKNPGNNVTVNNSTQQVVVPVSLQQLEEARAALRASELRYPTAPEVTYAHQGQDRPHLDAGPEHDPFEVLASDL